jgi:hypothetical protein
MDPVSALASMDNDPFFASMHPMTTRPFQMGGMGGMGMGMGMGMARSPLLNADLIELPTEVSLLSDI